MLLNFTKDIIKLILWYPLRWIVPFFPLRMIFLVGNLSGTINQKLTRSLSKAMYEELSVIFNGKYSCAERGPIVRQAFKLMAKSRLEELLFQGLNREKTDRLVTIKNLAAIDSALSEGKGVILVIAHFGANKLVMPALGFRGYQINQVAGKPTEWIRILGEELSLASKMAYQLELKNEQALPAKFIYVFESARPIFRCLKKNEIVCMAIDGGGGARKEQVGFLGRQAMISTGPFRIAQRTGAVVLPAFVLRQSNNTHALIVEDPIEMDPDVGEGENSLICLKKFVNLLETYVDRYPCHYAYRLALGRLVWQKDPIPLFTDYMKGKGS